MNINIWWCDSMKVWRWTITKTDRPIINHESGQSKSLKEVLDVIQEKV